MVVVGYGRAVTMPVASGALLQCSSGMMPTTLNVLPSSTVHAQGSPMATIQDQAPLLNVGTFGLCTSLANPITASQTTAAQGVLTPGTCTPAITAPWQPGAPTVLVGGVPALTDLSKCTCMYGGVIAVTVGRVVTVAVP